MRIWLLLCCFLSSLSLAAAAEPDRIRIGLLKFGTVAWEVDTLKHHGLDRAHGLSVEVRELASNEAAKIALQAGAVDLIVTDWVWVARQRAEGKPYTFVPYSRAVGGIVVPKDSPIAGLADLKGARLGVAGGALDKSWLIFRALAQKELGWDPARAVEPVFAAPPLLSAELERGRIEAVLTYWHYGARLQSGGARPLIGVAEMIERLGISAEVPMLGYAMREDWARRNPQVLGGFIAASRAAKTLLAGDPGEWTRLQPQLGTSDPAIIEKLQEGYRAGIPERWGAAEREAAASLYAVLAEIGGEVLVGPATELPAGTFWPGVQY